MKPISGKRMCRILERRGWEYDHTSGSHLVYKHPEFPMTLSVPVHGNRDMKIGTQIQLMRQAGLKAADL